MSKTERKPWQFSKDERTNFKNRYEEMKVSFKHGDHVITKRSPEIDALILSARKQGLNPNKYPKLDAMLSVTNNLKEL